MPARPLLLRSLLLLLLALPSRADELPDGYEIGDDSTSPDGRFAILYPVRDAPLPGGDYPPNLLVRLRPHAVLSKVGSTGLPQGVTTDLGVEWSGNSLVAIYESRKWGLLRLWVYELADDRVQRVHPVGDEARKIFDQDLRTRLLKKYPKEGRYFAWVSDDLPEPKAPDFEFRGRQLHLHLAADNKPNLAPGPHWTAQLRAIWDFDTGKFEKIDFRPGPITLRGEP